MEYQVIDMQQQFRQCFQELLRSRPQGAAAPQLQLQPLPAIRADMFLMKLLVQNLLSNSIKFTAKKTNPLIQVRAEQQNGELRFSVQDNGIGLGKADGDAFALFQRLHNERQYEGSGIGLAIVKSVAERFSGSVSIENAPGGGCLVCVSLPASLIARESLKLQGDDYPVRVGVVEDYSGDGVVYALYRKAAFLLAAEEINAGGGILGRPVELHFRNGKTDVSITRQACEELIHRTRVDVIMGSTLSYTRESIRAVSNANRLLFFNTQQDEDGLVDHYTFCLSSCPEQQYGPMLHRLIREHGKRVCVVSSKAPYCPLAVEWIKALTLREGGELVGSMFLDDRVLRDYAQPLAEIQSLQPDIVICLLIYEGNRLFLRQAHAMGMNHIPIASSVLVLQSPMHQLLPPPTLENLYVSAPFTEGMDSPAARSFVQRLRRTWEAQLRQDAEQCCPYFGMEAETAYVALHLYKEAVERAGTTQTEQVIHELESGEIHFDGPGGRVAIRGDTHHTIRDIALFRLDSRHELETLAVDRAITSDYIEQCIYHAHGFHGGIGAMGLNAPNVQYNLVLNRTDVY